MKARSLLMSTLLVVSYDSKEKAENVRQQLVKMQKEYLINLEDAVVATRDEKGKVHLDQMYNMAAAGAASGGFWGLLIGMLFLNPLLGFAAGAGSGAIAGALTDVGIEDDFMKNLAENLKDDSSMLFMLLDNLVFDKVLEELQGTGGTIIQTSLSHNDEEKLKTAIEKHKEEIA